MTEQQNFGGMGDLLKKLTENPEMLSKAMSMASALASSGALSGFMNSNTQDNTPKKECDGEPPPPPKAECPPPGKSGTDIGNVSLCWRQCDRLYRRKRKTVWSF